jgi:uncharacterized lipoprotein YddW (UPF0748 family)
VLSSAFSARRFALAATVVLTCLACEARAQVSTIPPASPDGVAQVVARQGVLEGRVMWLDGTANLDRLNSREGVARVLDKCVKANINTIVVDVKPLSGHVLYDSKIAPRLKEWKGVKFPDGYDLLKVALEEGRKRKLKIHANINVFSNGHKLVQTGPIYDNPAQQSVIYDVERMMITPRGNGRTIAVGVNRVPDADEIAIYDSAFRIPRQVNAGEAFALVLSDKVEAVVAGELAPDEGVRIPSDGYMLYGRGEGARWLLDNVRVGDELKWSATEKLLPILQAPSESVGAFVNPADPAMREYELKIVDELCANYDFDGIVFDRMRYASLQSDFSDFSRQEFEKYLGRRLDRFPADIYTFEATPNRPLVWGPFFKQWLEWRAKNIRTWLESASKIVRTKRPQAKIGVYVGSWYPSYYTVGVNWGSEEFTPGYEWMSPTYWQTGYAGLLDWITTGCYYPMATRRQARTAGLDESFTVQAAAELSTKAVGDVAWVYAGIYFLDYKGSPEAFRDALRAARAGSHGVMLFDLSQLDEYNWWYVLEEEFRQPRTAPHDVPGLLTSVRDLRKALSGANRNSLP